MFTLSYHISNSSTGFDFKGSIQLQSYTEVEKVVNQILRAASSPKDRNPSNSQDPQIDHLKSSSVIINTTDNISNRHNIVTPTVQSIVETGFMETEQRPLEGEKGTLTEIAAQIQRLDARTNYMKATVIVAVLTTEKHTSGVHLDTITQIWKDLGIKMPRNLPRDVRIAVEKKQWMVEKVRDRFCLSESMTNLLNRPDGYLAQFYRQREKKDVSWIH